MAPKPGSASCSGISVEETHLLITRCPVLRGRESNPGFRMELENLFGGAKGKGASGRSARPKVPIRRAGADCPVVVKKRGNARGAKGTGHSRLDQMVNWQQEEPTGLGGGRQLSMDGTSRVS